MSHSPETRASLLLRLADRADEAAWQEFAKIYTPVVYRLALRRGLQHADAEDLSQQVLASVAKAIDRWNTIQAGQNFAPGSTASPKTQSLTPSAAPPPTEEQVVQSSPLHSATKLLRPSPILTWFAWKFAAESFSGLPTKSVSSSALQPGARSG